MKQRFKITVLPEGGFLESSEGESLLAVLRRGGLAPESPCGGNGSCQKCRVRVDGVSKLACQTYITRDLMVEVPQKRTADKILTEGAVLMQKQILDPAREGYLLAVDIGTTTVAGYLLDPSGREAAVFSLLNPQKSFGADVISRIQQALQGEQDALTRSIRTALTTLTRKLCESAGISPEEIGVVSVVGNPCMQQLFLGMEPSNLAQVPFLPVLTRSECWEAGEILPIWSGASLLIIPDISGYVGADTMAGVFATNLYDSDKITLLVDIGTNGEMVLGNKEHLIACSTAAGPALEGARIHYGMRGTTGAIDHVWQEEGKICCSVIGEGEAEGICGSGLIDAVAVLKNLGIINRRGRIQTTEEKDGERIVYLTDRVYLTQNDIREVQMAKGAIAAGILLMAQERNVKLEQIDQVLLAGAFGSFIRPESACAIGLLPKELDGKIKAVGNAAGSGAKMLACSETLRHRTDELLKKIQFIELASLENFQHTFGRCMSL